MHPHLIDWFRNAHINPDPAVVEQRWKTAEQYQKEVSRASVGQLLRLFISTKPDPAEIASFTEALLKLDKTFPVTGNTEELRLMAGVVMVTSFGVSSWEGDAFALGLQVAQFGRELKTAQPEILAEAEKYLQNEAENQRPDDFENPAAPGATSLSAKYKALRQAEASGDAAQTNSAEAAYHKEITTIGKAQGELAGQIRRLAEESSLLWWVFNEYSPSLNRGTGSLTAPAYALAAAAEAAERTHIQPPPQSASPLLHRALKPCKPGTKGAVPLIDFVAITDDGWRKQLLKGIDWGDCDGLLPITTALAKFDELGDGTAAAKVLSKLCPGIAPKRAFAPGDAAYQFYSELMFLRALIVLTENK